MTKWYASTVIADSAPFGAGETKTADTYEVDERTLSETGSYIVDAPQADTVQVTSANGTTISAEARNNPR